MFYNYILLNLSKPCKLIIHSANLCLLYAPYYIGKGTKRRYLSHKNIKNTKTHKDATTKSLLKNFTYDQLVIRFNFTLNEEDSYELEEKIIEEIGLDNLCNLCKGGNGGAGTMRKGKTYDEIYKERASEIKKKISEANTGQEASQETRDKLKTATTNYFSIEENRSKHSEYLTGRSMPESLKIANSMRFKNVAKSAEHKLKISNSKKGVAQSSDHKFNAAFSRSKNKYIMNVNNKKYLIIRQNMNIFLEKYNIFLNFYSAVNKKYIRIGNVRITFRKVERVRF